MICTRISLLGAFALGALALAACRPASAQLTFTYTSFDVPGAYTGDIGYGTYFHGISNNGTIVGDYDVDANMGSAFVLQNGSYTHLNYPGAVAGDYTYLHAVNSSGVMVGSYYQASTDSLIDYIYRNGAFIIPTPTHPIKGPPGFSAVTDSGLVASQYHDASNVVHGAIYNLNTDTFADVASVPISATQDFFLLGVNDSGDYVGSYLDANGNIQGAFNQGGTFTYLSLPGADSTRPSGINSSGMITGRYFFNNSADQAGFLYDHGTYYTLQYPGAQFTNVTYGAINDHNQIVGFYQDANGADHGLLIQITPEPGSVALLTGMVVSGGLLLRRARKRRVS